MTCLKSFLTTPKAGPFYLAGEKMPEISIVVPVYNSEKYICKCLDSLLNQTFSDIEIICVDDGSSDGTPAILDSYARQDPRVIVIHQTNTGIGGARNRGIALTREKLLSEVWGYDFYGDDRTLDTHIKLLRKELGEYANRITTLRGVGYRFEKD